MDKGKGMGKLLCSGSMVVGGVLLLLAMIAFNGNLKYDATALSVTAIGFLMFPKAYEHAEEYTR